MQFDENVMLTNLRQGSILELETVEAAATSQNPLLRSDSVHPFWQPKERVKGSSQPK